MTRNSSRRIRLLSWRYVRWAIALPTLPLAWWACTSHPLTQPVPEPEQQTDLYISVSPVRKLDLVFMIDNSPSMAPKVDKMKKNFPSLLTSLKDPMDGTYPDLQVAIIDSDLGTGGQYASGSCGPNDTNNHSTFGDLGNFQMRQTPTACGANGDALWLEYTKGKAINFDAKQDIGTVFGCLASNLGTLGCGEEHQLQAFEFALVAKSGDIPGRNTKQDVFLRPTAYLGLVFLSDEDDCSAATNDGLFGDTNHPELKGESASLRCATRAHQCNGKNLTETPPGYPTDAAFTASFDRCSARTDSCVNPTDVCERQSDGTCKSTDTSQKTDCSPLKSFAHIAQEMKNLKGTEAEEKLLVAGIFGWPLMKRKANGDPDLDAKGKPQFDLASAQYKIDLVPNPNSQDTTHPKVYDYWPVCYDPDHPEPKDHSFDQTAWGWGAEGGLRMSAFVDEFGENGYKYSICERDFSVAMKGIGDALAKKLTNLCVAAKLYDTDLDPTNNHLNNIKVPVGLNADCRVVYRDPTVNADGTVSYTDGPPLDKCKDDDTTGNVKVDCWQLSIDHQKCDDPKTLGQLIQVLRTHDEIQAGPLKEGTKVGMNCRTCPNLSDADFLSRMGDGTNCLAATCFACTYPDF